MLIGMMVRDGDTNMDTHQTVMVRCWDAKKTLPLFCISSKLRKS
ncbi:MAG: hypothetical protein ACI9BH_000840 [Paracoccaceae bacterium]|jgi:hypothetical protein